MANFTDSAMRNVTMRKVKLVPVFAWDSCTVNVVILLSEYFANLNLTSDGIIGILMGLIFLFSEVLFDGT